MHLFLLAQPTSGTLSRCAYLLNRVQLHCINFRSAFDFQILIEIYQAYNVIYIIIILVFYIYILFFIQFIEYLLGIFVISYWNVGYFILYVKIQARTKRTFINVFSLSSLNYLSYFSIKFVLFINRNVGLLYKDTFIFIFIAKWFSILLYGTLSMEMK